MKKIFQKKRIIFFVSLFFVLSFAYIDSCSAEGVVDNLKKNVVDGVVGSIASLAVSALGWMMNKVIAMVIGFAQYSDFVNNEQVKAGWEVVRDICNMFFILILLFIAFAVILRMESYSIKKSLPKLLIMAVLINFSRTICGILIDFSQIVMLTFIGPITVGSGNFSNALNVDKFLSLVSDQESNVVTATDAAVFYVIAVIFMLVSTVVMTAILISFVIRIVMFWVYIVLSPLAFLLSSFPGGQKYAGQFWGDFTKYLLNGPVLAFFLWLSLYVLGDLKTAQFGTTFSDAPIKILEGESFAKFTMAIGMLVGGLTISSQIGGMGASWGSNTVSNLKNKGLGAAKAIGKRVSGYDAVADRASAYMAMRRTARTEKINESTARLAGGFGTLKKTLISNPINSATNAVWGNFGAKKSKRLTADIEDLQSHNKVIEGANLKAGDDISKHRDNIARNNSTIDRLNNFDKIQAKEGKTVSLNGMNYTYSNKNKMWDNGQGSKFTDANFKSSPIVQKQVTAEINRLLGDNDKSVQEINKNQHYVDNRTEQQKENDDLIKVKEAERLKAEERQQTANKFGRLGLAVAGAGVGALFGGGTALGGAIGAFGAVSVADDLKDAGNKDRKMFDAYQANQVSGNREKMKDKTADEVRGEMNNANNSMFKRMAAALELIARKETDTKEVKGMRDRLVGGFGEKVKGNFEGEVSRNVVGASKLFDFTNFPDNREKVREKFENGSLRLDSVGADTLKECGREIAEGMKASTFKKQYDGLSDAMKASVVESLRGIDDYAAREKIAKVKSIDDAFGSNVNEKKKYSQKLSVKDIQDILNTGSAQERSSLKMNITVNGKLDNSALASDVYERLNDGSVATMKAVRSALGIS